MNDYKFGNYITYLRNRSHMSQTELAKKLGITNKAISKWENGKSKPTTDIIRKIAILFNEPIEKILNIKEDSDDVIIEKIVITGGPCAGKSTAMSWIQNAFTQKGYKVIFIQETATELITSGISPLSCTTNTEFQTYQLKLQIEKEKIYEDVSKKLNSKKVLIVCDRGTLDSKAYMSPLEYSIALSSIGKNEVELRDNYGAVFHLVTAAKGAEEFYTLDNNQARTETIEEARKADDKLIAAWTGHPRLRVIDNNTNFEGKMKRLISEISNYLGEPEPYEIERKYLIEYPNIDWLENNPTCQRIEIIQTYLTSSSEDEIRIRQRGINGNYIYFQTIKKKINNLKRLEIEKILSQEEYLKLLMQADTTRKQIRKTRYCLMYKNQYFEIDIYPFWRDKAIIEIELNNENEKVVFPKQIKVIKEVTNEEKYKNLELSKSK